MLQTIISRYDSLSADKQSVSLLLRRTDSGPLDERNKAILKELELGVDHDLACINADISHFTDALRQLTEKRCLLEEAKRKHQAALSPISTLPLEILTDVFRYAASDPINIFDAKHPAWSISKVSQPWRSITTRLCPDIWTRISIEFFSDPMHAVDVISLLDAVLSRSNQSKLEITMAFGCPNLMHFSTQELQREVWTLLTMHAERWGKLHLSVSPSDAHVLYDLQGHKLLSLQDCDVDCYDAGDFEMKPSQITAFEHTPELTHMSLKGINPDTVVPITTAKLERFRYRTEPYEGDGWVVGDGIPLEYFFDILRSSPKLAVFDVFHEYSSYATVSPRIIKPTLSKLVVNGTAFLRSLSLPALKDASLFSDSGDHDGPPGPPSAFLADFHDLLVQSRCSSLSRLLISVDILDQHLFSILELAPTLISFELRQRHGTWNDQCDVVMQEFIVQLANVETFVPLLEEFVLKLSIAGEVDIHFVDDAMVNMIAARRHRSLRKFRLDTDYARFCNLGKDGIERLKAFMADGLDVAVISMDKCVYPDPNSYLPFQV
ncbi:hypothetical protein ARMGADRAFT_1170516 [Armillaria gallica]|uniref:F-box domain-containing protein n=1 Tax=Armillaria gallica TaxID=47427 RepID=A0A2H3CWH4_ARMGA|nr:hypothetical protein ARMGADRAFT_1170516 [Armillaria gallica]